MDTQINRTTARTALCLYIIAVVLLFVVLLGGIGLAWNSQFQYARGQYGKICYLKDFVPKTVRHPIYFHSLDECKASIKI